MHSVTFGVIRVHFSPGCVHSYFIWALDEAWHAPFLVVQAAESRTHTHVSHFCYRAVFLPKFTILYSSANDLRAPSPHLSASKQLSKLILPARPDILKHEEFPSKL